MPPREFWDEPALRAALAARHMGKVVRAYRHHPHHGPGPRPLPQSVVAGWLTMSQPQLSRIELRAPVTDLDRLVLIAEVLAIPDELLWFAMPDPPPTGAADSADTDITRIPASSIPASSVSANMSASAGEETTAGEGLRAWTARGALQALRIVAHSDRMEMEFPRRTFLAAAGGAATSPAHEWLIAHTASDVGRTSGARVPLEVVDHLDQITARLRRMDDQLGGGALLGLVGEHLRLVTGLLGDRSYSDQVGRRLYGAAGELLRLAGFVAFDAAQHARAHRYWIAALHAAHAADDRALGANILGFWSCQAKDTGLVHDAVTLAESARAGHRDATPVVRAIIELRIAEAQANTRAVAQTGRAIDAAFDALAEVSPDRTEPDWAYWMDEAQAHAQAGYCYLKLGDHAKAREHLGHGLNIQDGYSREAALRHLLLGISYAEQQHAEPEQAVEHGHRALGVLSAVDSPRCVGHLQHLIDALRLYSNPGTTDFIDRAAPVLARYPGST